MSHLITVTGIVIDNLDTFERSCRVLSETLGVTVEFRRGQTKYAWIGRWYDDSPVPKHLFESEDEYNRVVAMSRSERQVYMNNFLGKCEHAIHIAGHECEIGVVRVGDHYELAWDWATSLMDVLGRPDVPGYVNPIVGAYAAANNQLWAEQQGYQWSMAYDKQNQKYELEIACGW